METGPEAILGDILSGVREEGEYQIDSSILLSGVFGSEDELKAWAEAQGLRYELTDLPARTTGRKKIVTFSRSE